MTTPVGEDEIQVLENQVFDLEIESGDAYTEMDQLSKRALRIALQLDIAREKLKAAKGEREHDPA